MLRSLKICLDLIANPKSAILVELLELRNMFDSLRSLCIIELFYKYYNPFKIS